MEAQSQDWIEAALEIMDLAVTVDGITKADFWDEQPYQPERDYPKGSTWAYVDVVVEEISTRKPGVQDLSCIVRVYTCHTSMADTDTSASTEHRAKALAWVPILRSLHQVLQGTKGTHFSKLDRVELAKQPKPAGHVTVYMMGYECLISDIAGAAVIELADEDADRGVDEYR